MYILLHYHYVCNMGLRFCLYEHRLCVSNSLVFHCILFVPLTFYFILFRLFYFSQWRPSTLALKIIILRTQRCIATVVVKGMNFPRNIRSRESGTMSGTNGPGNERSRERMLQGTNSLGNEYSSIRPYSVFMLFHS